MFLHKTDEVQEEYHKLHSEYNREDRYVTNWFYKPHTITALVLAVFICVYIAFTRIDSDATFESNVKIGLIATGSVFLLYSALQFKDGLFVRPHPVVWRVLMGISVIYLCMLVFLLFQKVEDVRQMLKSIDSSLGVPLPERSYADNCQLYTPDDPKSSFRHLMDTLNDEFMIAHLLGWFGKAFLLRDSYLCWIMSILFEILEVSLEHLLPNFAECWWDHIILDILVCNFLGFTLGLKIADWLKMTEYKWVKGGVNVEPYKWEFFTSWRRLAAVIVLILVINTIELNAFFLKFVLWIPPPHPINVARLIMWWGIGLPGVREFYQWVTDPNCKKFGPMSWMCVALTIMELLVWIKFGKGMFPKPHPPVIVASWVISLTVLSIFSIWFYGIRKQPNSPLKSPKKKN